MAQIPKRVAIMREFARRLGQLPGMRGAEYVVPDVANSYFDSRDHPLPWGVCYDGTEKEIWSDCHTQIEYRLKAGVELVFAYERTPMLTIGNQLLAEYRILIATANDQDEQLGGLIRSVANTSADVWAFPSKQNEQRGRVICVPEIVYTAPAKNPWWP